MAARWIAAVLGVIMFTIVGFFVVVALRPPVEPVVIAGPLSLDRPTTQRMASQPWIVSARLAPLSAGLETTISIRNEFGQPPAESWPQAELRMLEMAMPAVPVVLDRMSPGTWRGLAQPFMSGRWSLVVTIEGEELAFPFTAPDEQRPAS